MISVAPRNIKPLVVSPALAVETRETVRAVLEGYGVGAGLGRCVTGRMLLPGIGRWRGSLMLDDRKCVAEDGPCHAEQNSVDHDGVTSSPQSTQRILAYSGGVVAVFSYLCGAPFKQSALFAS